MRLVLDTNIVISGFINSQGPPARLLRMILNQGADLYYNFYNTNFVYYQAVSFPGAGKDRSYGLTYGASPF